MKRFLLIFCALFGIAIGALAQSDASPDDNGFVINMLQNQLSAPGRTIEVAGVSGLLSSQASVQSITISDDAGPWFRLENVDLDWTRSALLLGRLNINRLSAQNVTWLRMGQTPPTTPLPEAEATPFKLPELPVQVRVQELAIERFTIEEPVAGVPAVISANGSIDLVSGALDSKLNVRRLDAPGGSLDLAAAFSNETRQLGIDVHLQEPQGGLLSKLLRIENEPAIDLTLAGNGPLDNVDVTFALDAGGNRVAGGTIALRAKDDGLGFDVDLKGGLSPLIPPQFRDFFAGESVIHVAGVSKTGGGVRLDDLAIQGAVLNLNGSLDTAPDFFPRALDLTGSLGDPAQPPVLLPVPGGQTTINSAQLYVSYGQASRWNGFLVLDRLSHGDISMEDITLNMGGLAQDLDDPAQRNVTINLEGLATGVSSTDANIARALGPRFDLFADAALPPGGPIDIRQLQLSGNGLSVFSAGTITDMVYTGRNSVRVDDISPFGGLAGRELAGGLNLRADGSVSPLSGGFDLTLDGMTSDLRIGDPRVDNLLAGETTLAGHVTRDETGIRTEGLRLGNAQLDFASDGRISSTGTDFGFDARLNDLSLVDPRIGGAVTATGRATGDASAVAVTLDAAIPEGNLLDRALTDAKLGFNGTVAGTNVSGTLMGNGALDDLPIRIAGDVTSTDALKSIEGLDVVIGPNTARGDITRTGTGPITGAITLRAPDIAPVAALALTEASGAIEADLTLGPDADGGQAVSFAGNGVTLRIGDNTVDRFDLDAMIADALGVPRINGNLAATDMTLGGVAITTLTAKASQVDQDRMTFAATSRLEVGTLISTSGGLDRLDPGFAVTLEALKLAQGTQIAQLTDPATITMINGEATLTPLNLDFGTGALTAQGNFGETLEGAIDIRSLPLALANTIAPQLGLAGQIDGTARVSGPRTAPDVNFDVSVGDVQSTVTRAAGLPPINLDATGNTSDGRLNLDANVASGNGLSANVRGSAPMTADGALDIDATLNAFPLALIDRLAGNQGLVGTITGTARVTGPIADPNVIFDASGSALGARMLRDNGIPPVNLATRGSFATQAVTINEASVTGAGGLNLTGSGRVPLTGPGLNVNVAGSVPLGLADSILAQRDAQASGQIDVNASVTGSLAAPVIAGGVTLNGGTLVDPQTNVRLENITLDIGLADNTVDLRTVRADVSAGGSISAGGSLSLDGTRGFPADLTMQINDVRYTDGSFVTTRISGDLAVQGPLVGGGGLISGEIDLGETDISVAEGLGSNANAALEQVHHYLPPAGVQQTLDRAEIGEPSPPQSGNRTDLMLDIRIRAPRQIFVRGRGLDVEVGGEMVVRGTLSDVQPVGQFDLRRGRISILGQRIDFEEGSLQLVGNLDPQIHFVARTVSDDVTAVVTVDGSASSPEIVFSSDPELPQDEVLARIIFNRSSDNLSAFQLAQLAAAAAELAGGGGNGLLGQLRSSAGLDDLDVITESNGSTAVRAGRYIDDNIYLEVQTGSDGISRAQINIDLNRSLTARGSVGNDGNTTIGLFYERDY